MSQDTVDRLLTWLSLSILFYLIARNMPVGGRGARLGVYFGGLGLIAILEIMVATAPKSVKDEAARARSAPTRTPAKWRQIAQRVVLVVGGPFLIAVGIWGLTDDQGTGDWQTGLIGAACGVAAVVAVTYWESRRKRKGRAEEPPGSDER